MWPFMVASFCLAVRARLSFTARPWTRENPSCAGWCFFVGAEGGPWACSLFASLLFSPREEGRPPRLSVWIDADRFEGTRELELPRGLRFFPWQEEGGRPRIFLRPPFESAPKTKYRIFPVVIDSCSNQQGKTTHIHFSKWKRRIVQTILSTSMKGSPGRATKEASRSAMAPSLPVRSYPSHK